MSLDRVDQLVAIIFVTLTAATAGMLFDWWHLVYYAIPILSTAFMLMGSLNRRNRWPRVGVIQVAAFGVVLLLLFAVSQAMLGGDGTFGGLPTATAIFFYVIWPVTSVVAPLLYVSIYRTWLRHDLEETKAEHSSHQTPVAGRKS